MDVRRPWLGLISVACAAVTLVASAFILAFSDGGGAVYALLMLVLALVPATLGVILAIVGLIRERGRRKWAVAGLSACCLPFVVVSILLSLPPTP
jgi:hypothetical protein